MLCCGDEVPLPIRQAICKDISVDFNDLLMPYSLSTSASNQNSKYNLTIKQWEKCFRKFMVYYLPSHRFLADGETLMVDMFTHMDTVFEVAESGGDWYTYDAHFHYLQCSKYIPWSAQRLPLILKYNKSTFPHSKSGEEIGVLCKKGILCSFSYWETCVQFSIPLKFPMPG